MRKCQLDEGYFNDMAEPALHITFCFGIARSRIGKEQRCGCRDAVMTPLAALQRVEERTPALATGMVRPRLVAGPYERDNAAVC